MAPNTQYARKGDVSIAYQVLGGGPIDLVLVNGLVAHMDLLWLEPQATATLRRLASFSRLILFDKPGTGLSDPVAGAPTIEQRMGDIEAVMDAVGSERAWLLGFSEGGMASAMFAATYPRRVEALVLVATAARFHAGPGYFEELPAMEERWREIDEVIVPRWGEGHFAARIAPSWEDPVHRRLVGVVERACASPGMARALFDSVRELDVRPVLPTLALPTLVLHRRGDTWTPVELARDLAERIAGARFVELPGDDHLFFAGDWQAMVSEIQDFLTGERDEPEPDRVLKTVLFTDIVGSTRRAAEIGDQRWRQLLDHHERVTRRAVEEHGGRVVKSLGDGVFACFDRPTRAVRCAQAVVEEIREMDLEVRAGVHTGECEVLGEDLGGLAVHIGARISALAEPLEVLVSSTVCDLVVGSGIAFSDRGTHELKGVPGRWRLYGAATDHPGSSHAERKALTPGPRETMRPIDRAVVAVGRYAPGFGRTGVRLGRRWGGRDS